MTSTSLRLYARLLRMSGGSGAHPAPPGGCGGSRRLHGDQRGSHPPTRRRADRKGRHRPLPATAESGRGRTVRPDQGRRHRLPHGGRSVSIPCILNVTSTISVKDLRLEASFFRTRIYTTLLQWRIQSPCPSPFISCNFTSPSPPLL